jgi:hypothetical protein
MPCGEKVTRVNRSFTVNPVGEHQRLFIVISVCVSKALMLIIQQTIRKGVSI